MADKKITALTALGAGDPDPALDLLHIIDYSASPVNKKITVANLFSRVDTNISSIGATTFEIGATTVISGLKVVVPNVVPAGGAETEVIVNEGSNEFVDFRVETDASAQAIYTDASADTVYINGDSANVDFRVNGDTGVTAFSDASYDALGVGTNVLDGNYRMQVAGDGVVIDSTGAVTGASTALTMTSTTAVVALGGTVSVFGPGIAAGTTAITTAGTVTATNLTLSASSTAAVTSGDGVYTFLKASATGGAIQAQGWLAMATLEEHRTADGNATCSNAVAVTRLVSDDATTTRTLTLGTSGAKDGQIKHIYFSEIASGSGAFVLQATNRLTTRAQTFQQIGDSATFMYDASQTKWCDIAFVEGA